MQIAVIGMNQDTAPIQIRNRVAYLESDKIELTTQLLDAGINELVILATCGRNEIYLCDYKENMDQCIDLVLSEYSKFFKFPEVKNYLYIKRGDVAVKHLYSVASGFDSIVLGEDQILGQVKEAHNLAMELGASKKIMNQLFRDAITTSKKIKTELKISEHPMSISYIGVKFLLDKMKTFESKRIFIIGTGKMGQLALKYIMENNPDEVYMTNRNHQKVIDLKMKYPSIKEVKYTERHTIFREVDAIITATASPHHVITLEDIPGDHKKLHILDLAMPQDVDEVVGELENVILFNVDSLNKISEENELKRYELSIEADKYIDEKLDEFNLWMLSIKVDPMIESLNMLRELVEKDTLEYIHRRVDLDGKSRKLIDKMVGSSLKRMIRDPIIRLKAIEDEEKMHHYLDVLNDLFNFHGEWYYVYANDS